MDIIEPVRYRRDGRVVECAGLEIQYTVKRIQGSNPCLSAMYQAKIFDFVSVHGDAIKKYSIYIEYFLVFNFNY